MFNLKKPLACAAWVAIDEGANVDDSLILCEQHLICAIIIQMLARCFWNVSRANRRAAGSARSIIQRFFPLSLFGTTSVQLPAKRDACNEP